MTNVLVCHSILYPQLKPEPQPDPPPPHEGEDFELLTDAAKDESSFSTFSDLHFVQATIECEPRTNSSNLLSHSVHLYSNIGIYYFFTFLSNDITRPATAPNSNIGYGFDVSCQVEPMAQIAV